MCHIFSSLVFAFLLTTAGHMNIAEPDDEYQGQAYHVITRAAVGSVGTVKGTGVETVSK